MTYWVLKIVMTPVLRVLFRVRSEGTGNVPRHGPVILASNHQSFIDSVFLPLVVRRRVTFVAKAEYFESRKTAWIFRSLGMIPLKRDGGPASARALAAATEVLESGRGPRDLSGRDSLSRRLPVQGAYRRRPPVHTVRRAGGAGRPVWHRADPADRVDVAEAVSPGRGKDGPSGAVERARPRLERSAPVHRSGDGRHRRTVRPAAGRSLRPARSRSPVRARLRGGTVATRRIGASGRDGLNRGVGGGPGWGWP